MEAQPGHIGAHQRENRPETLRTAEIAAAGQAACLLHPSRSNAPPHKTRPTGQLVPGILLAATDVRRHIDPTTAIASSNAPCSS
jgi:hypothetical protein